MTYRTVIHMISAAVYWPYISNSKS